MTYAECMIYLFLFVCIRKINGELAEFREMLIQGGSNGGITGRASGEKFLQENSGKNSLRKKRENTIKTTGNAWKNRTDMQSERVS